MADNDPHVAPSAPHQPPPPPAPQIVIARQRGLLGTLGMMCLAAVVFGVALLFLMALVGSLFGLAEGPREKFHSLSHDATKKIAVIDASGALMDQEDGFIKQQIDRVRKDDNVVAVVLRINSPGGTVTAADYLYHHLRKLADERDLPLVVSMGSICASGGYYIAMAVGDRPDAIFAEPTTWTGSIGVIIPHFDLSGLMGRFNIKDDSIASGPLKQMASPTRPMTDEERKLLQELVDESFDGFKDIVARGRPKFKDDPAALAAVATGQIFTAKQALQRGLVDKLGFVEDAIQRAAELAGYDTKDVRCIHYEEPTAMIDALLGDARTLPSQHTAFDPAAWLDLTAPRAYYLWTWLPTTLTNSKP